MTTLRRVGYGLGALLLTLPVAFIMLFGSETGSAWLLRRVGELAAAQGVGFAFDGSHGTLLGDLELRQVALTVADQRFDLDHLRLRWRPGALLHGRLHIIALDLDALRIVPAGSAPSDTQPPALPDLRLPVGVHVDQLHITDLRMATAGEPFVVDRVTLAARLDRENLAIEHLELAGPGIAVTGQLGLQPAPPHDLRGQLALWLGAEWVGAEAMPLAADLALSGTALRPAIRARIHSPTKVELNADLALDQVDPGFEVEAAWQSLSWPPDGNPWLRAEAGQARLAGRFDQYRLEFDTRLQADQLPTSPVHLVAHAAGRELTLEALTISVPAPEPDRPPAELNLRGPVHFDGDVPAFALAVDWSALRWPLRGTPQLHSATGTATLRGSIDAYQAELQARLQPVGLPGADLHLDARGDRQALQLQALTLDTLRGQLRLQGQAGWEPAIGWGLDLQAHQLDPGAYLPDWPGRLDGVLRLDGGLTGDGQWQLQAHIGSLTGSLRDYPIDATGELAWNGRDWRAAGITLNSGPNRVYIDGLAGQQLDARFELDAPQLAALYPGLGGSLAGSGRLGGSLAAPRATARVQGQRFSFNGLGVDTLDLDIDWQDAGGTGTLRATGLRSAQGQLASVDLRLDGEPQSHRLNLSAGGGRFHLDAAAAGGFAQGEWRGALQALNLDEPGVPGHWQLQDSARLQLAPAAWSVSPVCLVSAQARLCAAGGARPGGELSVNGHAENLDLAWLAPYLPGDAVIAGRLQAQYGLAGSRDRPRAWFELRPDDGLVRFEAGTGGEPVEVSYRNTRIDARFEDDTGRAELQLDLGANGQAQGRLTLGPARNGQRPLDGRVEADFPDLKLVEGFVPALQQVRGRLHLAGTVGGTLDTPRVAMDLQLDGAGARLPVAGIELEDAALRVQGQAGTPLRVDGQVRSGAGVIRVAGSVDLDASPGPRLALDLTGENFQATRLPEATVLVSPSLHVQGDAAYRLSGTLRIPQASVVIKDLPAGTVMQSEDAIVVGEETARTAAPRTPGLTAQVRVELGDDVRFKGFGLSTRLAGNLDAASDTAGTRVTGKIELHDGRYLAYGQELTVERGRLLFAGPPDNPDLDMRALRNSVDGRVKAYLAVNGPLKRPVSRVYSEPALPQAQALAYLLTGRSLDKSDRQQGLNIAAAALSMGLSKGEPLIQDLGDRLGLDELRVEGGSEGLQDSSLILGKYLDPKLYLGYTQGLFEPVGAVLLRLKLSEKLDLETRSGEQQSIDLFYRIEHD